MRTRIPIVRFLGAPGSRWTRSLMAFLIFGVGLVLGGCGPAVTRPPVTQQDLLKLRTTGDEQAVAEGRRLIGRVLQRAKAEYDRRAAAGQPPPVIDILIISGGGDWGAFGAGFLKGWQKLPAGHPLVKPEFDAVTGVSTGTLIAPFAFLGDEQSTDQIVNLYRNPQEDWVRQRGYLYFLPDNISFAEVPGLEREMRKHITLDLLRRIEKAGADGRVLAVNTTDLDTGTSRVFDLVAEARRAADSGQVDRVHNIMLASAGIPGAFPFRIIDDELYVDGGVTGNIIYGGRIAEEDSLPAAWQKAYPKTADPQDPLLGDFQQSVPSGAAGGCAELGGGYSTKPGTSTREATATAVRHLFVTAEISRLKRKAEVRVVSISGDWFPPVPGVFIKESMNNLGPGRKDGRGPGELEQRTLGVLST